MRLTEQLLIAVSETIKQSHGCEKLLADAFSDIRDRCTIVEPNLTWYEQAALVLKMDMEVDEKR